MMLLLDFAVACVDCTGGNKKKTKKQKNTETGSITILTERYLSVNNYIYQKIGLSGSILREVLLLKNALLPFQNELRVVPNDSNDGAHNRYKICRSRDIYLLLRDKVTSKVLSATNI